MYCAKCGKENNDHAKFCAGCGGSLDAGAAEPVRETAPAPVAPTYARAESSIGAGIHNMRAFLKKNMFGTVGFFLAVIAIYLFWFPVIGQVIWLSGIVFSIVGIYKTPKSLPTAGLVLSFIILAWQLSVNASGSPASLAYAQFVDVFTGLL